MLEFKPEHYLQKLQPLRIPAGWTIGWNTFQAIEVPEDGFGGDSLLYLLRNDHRMVIDVEWRPEFDPSGYFNYYTERLPLRSEENPEYERLNDGQSRERNEVVTWIEQWAARGAAELSAGWAAADLEFIASPQGLAPLHMSSGWRILCNAITETEPVTHTGNPVAPLVLFRAIAEQRRFRITVTLQPDEAGVPLYGLEVLYAPWPRTERGRRRKEIPPNFDNDPREMHHSRTHSYSELQRLLEAWLWRASGWAVEGN